MKTCKICNQTLSNAIELNKHVFNVHNTLPFDYHKENGYVPKEYLDYMEKLKQKLSK